ncbi:MAG TPA: peptidoglycan editing factor PgeF [Oxalobacteraceae bacterium]|jgi:YfiH family protein|nr:peptidoglycan editing factor PgeF [Oxalobacteraceae bacterium]
MDLIVPDWPDAPANIGALTTMRRGGISCGPYDDGRGGGGLNLGDHVGDRAEDVAQNRLLLHALLPAQPAWLTQVHGNRVLDAGMVVAAPQADASIATQPGIVCAILTADCLPVLLCDVAGRVVGAAHAGWRGLARGVLENTVARMQDAGARELLAWLGPAIGPAEFEVGPDVRDAFVGPDADARSAFMAIPGKPGKYLADIYQLAHKILFKAGVRTVYGGKFCTVSDTQRFYSYRRDGVTGRMASLIWIKS